MYRRAEVAVNKEVFSTRDDHSPRLIDMPYSVAHLHHHTCHTLSSCIMSLGQAMSGQDVRLLLSRMFIATFTVSRPSQERQRSFSRHRMLWNINIDICIVLCSRISRPTLDRPHPTPAPLVHSTAAYTHSNHTPHTSPHSHSATTTNHTAVPSIPPAASHASTPRKAV